MSKVEAKIVATVSDSPSAANVDEGSVHDDVDAAVSSGGGDDAIATNSEDFVIFGAHPARFFDDISDAVDTLLAEEVSTLPLLPRTLTSAQQQHQQQQGEKGKNGTKIETGEQKLLTRLRSAFKKNLDLAEVYCQRNIFTIRNYPKTKRRKILERYLVEVERKDNECDVVGGDAGEIVCDDGDGTSRSSDQGPTAMSDMTLLLLPDGVTPTIEQISSIDESILVTRARLQIERRRKVELTRQLQRIHGASETLRKVQLALKAVENDRSSGGVTRVMTMEALKGSVTHAVAGHEELKIWNTKAEEVICILDKIKVDREGGKVVVSPSGTGKMRPATLTSREEDERERKRTIDEIGGSHGTKEQVESFLKKLRGSVEP